MKYVTIQLIQRDDKGKEVMTKDLVVAFPNDMVHAVVAQGLMTALQLQWPSPQFELRLMSAGDIAVRSLGTGGHSESLKVKARDVDSDSFNGADYGFNINVPRNSK